MVEVAYIVPGRSLVAVEDTPALVAAGVHIYRATRFPTPPLKFAALLGLRVSGDDPAEPIAIAVDLVDARGASCALPDEPPWEAIIELEARAGLLYDVTANMALYGTLAAVFPTPGLYFVVARIGGREAGRTAIRLAEGQSVAEVTEPEARFRE